MRLFSSAVLSLLCWTSVQAQPWPCGTCTNDSPEPIIPAPPPWILKATAYAVPLIPIGPLPSKAYAPLEKGSTATQGTFLGLAGAILIIRYSDTPVGPYDEFTIIPGLFGYEKRLPDGTTQAKVGIRGSRFYVSQKYTNWNGRVSTCFARLQFPCLANSLLTALNSRLEYPKASRQVRLDRQF
jgi:hypothetical protein